MVDIKTAYNRRTFLKASALTFSSVRDSHKIAH